MTSRDRLCLGLLLAGALAASGRAQDETPPPSDRPERKAEQVSEDILIPIRGQVIPGAPRTRLGDWWLTLFGAELVQYDDNIFLEDHGADSDYVSLTTAGAKLSRRGAEMEAELVAALSGEVFLHESDENTWGGYLQGGARLGFGHGHLHVLDTFTRRKQALQFSDVQNGVVVAAGATRTEQIINEAGLDGGYDWEKVGVEARYQNTFWDYGRELDSLDALGHTFTALGKHQATEKLEVNAQYEFRTVAFDQDVQNGFTVNGLFVGARWQASEKVSLDGRAGYLSESSDDSGSITDDHEYQGPAGQLTLGWAVSEKTQAELLYAHELYIAAGNNYQIVDLVRPSVRWQLLPLWNLRLRLPLQFSHPSESGDSTIYGAGVTLGYRPQDQLDLALSYDFQARSSDEPQSDFTNNRIGLQVSITF